MGPFVYLIFFLFQSAGQFHMIDNNRDMKISRTEAMDYFKRHQNMTMKNKKGFFSGRDTNLDGFISPDEFDNDLNMNVLKASKKYF